MKREQRIFRTLCKAMSKSIEYNQGTGGNISVKLPDGKMIIKSSGSTLEEAAKKDYVIVENDLIKRLYESNLKIGEASARESINKSVVFSGREKLRPSMETGFHSFLPTNVIHVHPIYLVALLSLDCPEVFLDEALQGMPYRLVPYAKPGERLSAQVRKYSKRGPFEGVHIYLLQNHGLIVADKDPDLCADTTIRIIDSAKDFVKKKTNLDIAPYDPPKKIPPTQSKIYGDANFVGQKIFPDFSYFFPDSAVFLEDKKRSLKEFNGLSVYFGNKKEAQIIDEVLYAHNQVNFLVEALSSQKRALNRSDIDELISMEEEKFRRAQSKGGNTCR